MIILLATKGNNNEIGKENELIWKLKYADKKLNEKTKGNVLVMGKNTFNSINKIQKDREYIVISTTKRFNKDIEKNVKVVDNVLDLIKKCREISISRDVYIVGGESLYNLFIDYADKMYITEIDDSDEKADAFFPKFDKKEWNKEVLDVKDEKDINFSFVEYMRKQ